MDGFDLGIAMWLPVLTRTDTERQILLRSVEPVWEGNQVWFILGGGAIFAAWPALYALSFSGFYIAMLLVLLALILRPVGFKYRSKLPQTTWRHMWDMFLCVSGVVPACIFGVAIGNVLQGVPFHFDLDLRPMYTGTFLELLNPFGLLCGVLSILMLAMHGAFYISNKTQGHIQHRAETAGRITALCTTILFALGGWWLYTHPMGYALTHPILHEGPSNPLYKEVELVPYAWFSNYHDLPITRIFPFLGLCFPLLAALFIKKLPKLAFGISGLSLFGIIATVGVSMFPFILPSSSNPSHSLVVWDSSSSHLTLFIMLVATCALLPIILLYTAWVYRMMRGKIGDDELKSSY